jgi:predicted nucleic acid-binding Zn ribbon protein
MERENRYAGEVVQKMYEMEHASLCVDCGENAPEDGTVCEECKEARLYD